MNGSQPTEAQRKRAYVVLVNFRGWRDTIECLESLLRTTGVEFQVVVCDNGSGDDSLEHMQRWAQGGELVASEFPELTEPALAKPLPFVRYDRAGAEAGGRPDGATCPLVLVDCEANLGFAGGCNVGMRYALAQEDCGYIWLLNNDTVVPPDSLAALVRRMERDAAVGMCGSLLLFYDDREIVQAAAGSSFDPLTTATRHVDSMARADAVRSEAEVEAEMDYVVGASMLVRREFVEDVGLMGEDYFLYFEELDWALRARRRGGRWRMAFARESLVYHKEGRSIGTATDAAAKSPLSDWYMLRNRVRFIRRYFPMYVPLAYAGLLAAAANRVRRRQWRRLQLVACAALGLRAPSWVKAPR